MQEIIDLIGAMLKIIEVTLKMLTFLKERHETNRNHPR
jgi:hypothetical protein